MGDEEASTSVREVWRILGQHRRASAYCFVVVMGAVALITLLIPRTYRSEAKLFLRLGRENVALDPTTTFGQGPVVAVPQSRENEINSVIETLKSRVLVESVVDAVGPDAILGQGPLRTDPPAAPIDPRIGAQDRERERAIRKFFKTLGVELVKKSNVIALSFEGSSPEVAQAVLAKFTEACLDQHIRLNRTPRAHEFLAEQTAKLRAQLTQMEEELRDLKKETGLGSPEGQLQIVVNRIGRLQDELLQAGAATAAAEAEVRLLRDKAAAMSPTQVTARTQGFPNTAADTMRGQLYALQLKEQELLSKYPERHPEVQLIREQTRAAQAILAKEERGREQVTLGPSRTFEEIQLALARQEPVLAGLRARATALQAQLDRERSELKTLTDNNLRLAKLQREIQLQDAHYRKYSENLEQTRIDQALETQRISNINIVQPATYDIEPVRPRWLLNLGLGLVLAVAGCVGLPLLVEIWEARHRQPAREELDLAVAASSREVGTVPVSSNGLP
jgi:uncharacterized protein involved in exopolysaccharide biosynthesis